MAKKPWPRIWPCIAASKPKSLDASGVPAELLDVERRIAIEKAAKPASRKPCSKIAEGTVQKFLKDVTLLDQVFVKAEDGKQTVSQLLKAKNASVAGFTLYIVGEGIEKKVTDFCRRSGCPGRRGCSRMRKEFQYDEPACLQAHSPSSSRAKARWVTTPTVSTRRSLPGSSVMWSK